MKKKQTVQEGGFNWSLIAHVSGSVIGSTIAKFLKGFVYTAGAILAIKLFWQPLPPTYHPFPQVGGVELRYETYRFFWGCRHETYCFFGGHLVGGSYGREQYSMILPPFVDKNCSLPPIKFLWGTFYFLSYVSGSMSPTYFYQGLQEPSNLTKKKK